MYMQDGDIKVKLSYLHPACASETDVLFGGTPAKRLKAHKRKHGSQPQIVGEQGRGSRFVPTFHSLTLQTG